MAASTAMVPVSVPADDPAPATHSGAPADAGVGQIGGGWSRVFDTAYFSRNAERRLPLRASSSNLVLQSTNGCTMQPFVLLVCRRFVSAG